MNRILSSISRGYVASCHDVSEGGIGVCLSEMAIGGDIGAHIDLSAVGTDLRTDFKLFSESNSRWIVEVKKDKQNSFEKLLTKENTPFILIGKTQGKTLAIKDNEKTVINLEIMILRESWKNTIWAIMG